MRTLSAFSLVLGLFISGCAAESASIESDETPVTLGFATDAPLAQDRPAPFAEDRNALPTTKSKVAAAFEERSIESDDTRRLEAESNPTLPAEQR